MLAPAEVDDAVVEVRDGVGDACLAEVLNLCAACARSVVPTVPLTPVTEEALSDSADVPAASAAARCEVCVEAESRERLLLGRAAGACGSAAVLYLAWRASRPRRR